MSGAQGCSVSHEWKDYGYIVACARCGKIDPLYRAMIARVFGSFNPRTVGGSFWL